MILQKSTKIPESVFNPKSQNFKNERFVKGLLKSILSFEESRINMTDIKVKGLTLKIMTHSLL